MRLGIGSWEGKRGRVVYYLFYLRQKCKEGFYWECIDSTWDIQSFVQYEEIGQTGHAIFFSKIELFGYHNGIGWYLVLVGLQFCLAKCNKINSDKKV